MCEAAEVLRTSKDVDGRSCSEAPKSGGAGGEGEPVRDTHRAGLRES